MKKDKISIVVPCYNEEETISLFYKEINKLTTKMIDAIFEILFVDDGSDDNTLKIIKQLYLKDKRIKYLSFSRNFGKEAAMYAGLSNASGDFVTLMDADLQDPPEMLIEMYNILKNEDYDQVGTRRFNRRGEPIIRSFFARKFYKIINKLSKVEMVDGARDFRLMKRCVVDAILSLKEYNRYSKGLFNFVGFKTKWLEYENKRRVAGKSKWNFFSLFRYAIEGIVAFSTVPLSIATFMGLIICFLSFIAIVLIIIKTVVFGDPVGGWPSMVCIILFISGIQLFCMGIIGMYISKTYLEVKNRPVYIIKEKKL